MTTEHNPLTCQYCHPLPCEDYHEAAQNIHAYLRSLVNRNWVKDMAKAKAEAKKLWKVRHTERPDYRTEEQRERMRVRLAGHRGGIAAGEVRTKSTEPRKRPSRAAYMRKYRKTHPEA